MNYLNFQRICIVMAIAVWCTAAYSQSDVFRPPYKWACQWSEGNDFDEGCTGMIGLMRLQKSSMTDFPGWRKKASKSLFGSEELPAVGSVVVIQRSAHLRREYWPDRDDQNISPNQKICNRVGCFDTGKKQSWCSAYVGENSEKARSVRRNIPKLVYCPGPTDKTEYFSAGTVVKILGYQQMGAFFALVQIVKIESTNPELDEKKYSFDRKEVI